jgi:hypothetical protein
MGAFLFGLQNFIFSQAASIGKEGANALFAQWITYVPTILAYHCYTAIQRKKQHGCFWSRQHSRFFDK